MRSSVVLPADDTGAVLSQLYQQATTTADWRRVAGLWEQCTEILRSGGDGAYLPDIVTGKLARAMGQVFASYDDDEDRYVQHLLAIMCRAEGRDGQVDDHFRDLYFDERFTNERYQPVVGRRLPPPFEAAVETARRLRDLARIRDALTGKADLCACVLGGSASYGRFHNTVGAREGNPSDLDLLLVVAPSVSCSHVYEALRNVYGLAGAEHAIERGSSLEAPDDADAGTKESPIFSHKLSMWRDVRDPLLDARQIAGDYRLSTHVLTLAQFRWITIADKPVLAEGLDRRVWDLRETKPTREDLQRTFAGTVHPVERRYEQTAQGWLAESYVAQVTDERFRPGLHQNLILPRFDLRWDLRRHRLALPIYAFRWKIMERLEEERRLRPYEDQRISRSHTRAALFAPHVSARVDAS